MVVALDSGRRRQWWGHLAALAAGGIASFGFAPYAHRWALWIGLILFFSTLHASSPSAASKRGWLFGVGYFGPGIYWVYYSLHHYASTPLWLAVMLAGVLVSYLALYPMLAAWLATRLLPKGVFRLTLAAVTLAGAEWLRGTLLTGLPWVLVGQASLDSPWAGYLPLVGVYGAGLLLLLAAAWTTAWLYRPFSERAVWLGAVALMVLAGESSKLIPWSDSAGQPQKVALIQSNLEQGARWRREHLGQIRDTYRDLTKSATNAEIIIFPEAAIPLYYKQIEGYYDNLQQNILGNRAILMAGAFYHGHDPGGPRNGLVNIATGERYGKRRLVPFGEFTPFAEWLAPLYGQVQFQMRDLTPSQDRPLLTIGEHKVGASICYESIYPAVTRMAFPEAAWLVNVSNDAWFGESRAPWQHLEAARLRAAETSRDLLRVASTGVTAIIGPDGGIRMQAPQYAKVVLEGEVRPRSGVTPYTWLGEWGFLGLLGFGLAMSFRRRNKRSLRFS